NLLTVTTGHTGTLNFLSAMSKSGPAGGGFLLDNADGTYIVNGNLTVTAGIRGVEIRNGSSGTVNFVSAGSSITGVTGISFRVNTSTATVDYNGNITHTSQANRGIEIIQGTGTISFDGIIDIGNIITPMQTAVSVFLSDTGATNLISFANLNIFTGSPSGLGSPAFVSEISGRIAVTIGNIRCDGNIGVGNHCFDVSNTTSNGVTFATFVSDHYDAGEAGGAIFLNNTPGTFTFEQNLGLTGLDTILIHATNFGTLNFGTVT
ncbi:MAG TPA: hypothetical protein PLZ51_22800, partial [Aggregatilineales bacterium]|nr:hypothetical protein [Aggregatilineales bacterium]